MVGTVFFFGTKLLYCFFFAGGFTLHFVHMQYGNFVHWFFTTGIFHMARDFFDSWKVSEKKGTLKQEEQKRAPWMRWIRRGWGLRNDKGGGRRRRGWRGVAQRGGGGIKKRRRRLMGCGGRGSGGGRQGVEGGAKLGGGRGADVVVGHVGGPRQRSWSHHCSQIPH